MASGGIEIDERRTEINNLFGPNDHIEDDEEDVSSEDMEFVHINHKVQFTRLELVGSC